MFVPHLKPHPRRVLERLLHLLIEQIRHESRTRSQDNHRKPRHAQQKRPEQRRVGRDACEGEQAYLHHMHAVRVCPRIPHRMLLIDALQTRQ